MTVSLSVDLAYSLKALHLSNTAFSFATVATTSSIVLFQIEFLRFNGFSQIAVARTVWAELGLVLGVAASRPVNLLMQCRQLPPTSPIKFNQGQPILHELHQQRTPSRVSCDSVSPGPERTNDIMEPDITRTSYTTVVPTVFHVGTGTAKSDYVTRKVNPYTPPGQKKREITEAPAPTPAPELELRQAVLPTFASSCSGDANRLSSACTCLIGNTPYTVVRRYSGYLCNHVALTLGLQTTTVARNAPGGYRTVGVCGAPESGFDNHNVLIDQGGFENTYNHGQISFAEYEDINDIDVCCKKCYHTPEWSVSSLYILSH